MADAFRRGRAFLVGDAARAVTPLGAFGLNTGVADAHNLAWKLAMVPAGQAADRLLDSYHQGRHAVAELVTRQALLRWENPRMHWDPTAVAERRAAGAWNAPMVTMGYRYASSAVIDPVVELPSTEDLTVSLDGAPGSRLPHRWPAGGTVSTLDLNRSRFAVPAGATGEDWRGAARAVAATLGMDLDAVVLDEQVASSLNLANDEALLVRPDGFIAWRTRGTADPARLEQVLAAVTGRQGRPAPSQVGCSRADRPSVIRAEPAVVAGAADVEVQELGQRGAAVPEAQQVDVDECQPVFGGEAAGGLGEDA